MTPMGRAIVLFGLAIVAIGLVDPAIPATTRWAPAAAPGILADLTRLTAGMVLARLEQELRIAQNREIGLF